VLLVDWKTREGMSYTPCEREKVSGLYTEGLSIGEVLGDDMGGNWMGL
jgi:hypothetical protein